MSERRIPTQGKELEELLRGLLLAVQELQAGAATKGWVSFGERINIGPGGLVLDGTGGTGIELLLVNPLHAIPTTTVIATLA